jgi:hypothetical protein
MSADRPHLYKPGESGNPSGRKPGSKNKIGRDFHDAYEQAKDKGYSHPYLVMMEWAHDESKPVEIRAAMLKECASYTCTKPKLTIRSEVPVLTSIEQAEAFLATLTAESELDPIELLTAIRHWIDSKRDGQELQLKIQDHRGSAPEQRILIEGGLPDLPGTNVIMPELNEAHNGHTLDLEKNAETTLPAPPADESTSQDPGQ